MEDVLKTLNLFDDNEIFRGYTTMIELCNALKFITMLIFIQNILTFNLGVAFLKSVIIVLLCLPPEGLGDILFFPRRLSVRPSVRLSVTNRVRSVT